MSRKTEAEHRRARREYEDVLAQLLEEEWHRWAPLNSIEEWSEDAEHAMLQAIRTRHRPLSHRNTGTIIDVNESVESKGVIKVPVPAEDHASGEDPETAFEREVRKNKVVFPND